MQAQTRSPSRASGMPTAAASSTFGCWYRTSFDLAWVDVGPAPDNQLLLAIDDFQIASRIENSDIARGEPAIHSLASCRRKRRLPKLLDEAARGKKGTGPSD